MSQKNAVDLQNYFGDNKVDVVVNVDHTFVYFYPEWQVVVAPKFTDRVVIKVKSDAKSRFTSMVTRDIDSSKMTTPFVVYNGTKLKDARFSSKTPS